MQAHHLAGAAAGVASGLTSLNARFAKLGEALDKCSAAIEASIPIMPAAAVPDSEPTFGLSFWPNIRCTSASFEQLTAGALAARIRMAEAESKALLPSFSGGRFGGKRSPKNSLRHLDNLAAVTAIIGDHDAGTMQPWEAAQRLTAAGIRCLIYTTPSHGPAKPRWRPVLPTSRPLPPTVYRRLVDKVDAILGGKVLATESRNPVQFWFFGRIEGQPEPEVFVIGGPLAIDEASEPEPPPDTGGDDAFAELPNTSPLGLTADPELVASAVAAIPNAGAPDWTHWNDMLMAIYAAINGSEEGRAIAREWSAKNAAHDDATFDARWDHFAASPPTRGGAGKLFFLATKHGWQDPRREAPPDTGGDLSNSRRLAERINGSFLYDATARQWRCFDGVRWTLDYAAAMREAKAVADMRVNDALREFTKSPTDAAKRTFAQALAVHKSAPRIEAMLRLAQSDTLLVTKSDEFDADPLLFGVPNGVIDLRTGSLRDAMPGDRLTKIAGVSFQPDAECPRWMRFLTEVCDDDRETVSFLARAVGYTLTGRVDEEALFFLHGQGRNGKSVFANVLSGVFGDYAASVGTELLARRRNDNEASRLRLRLQGARLVLANEVGEGDRWDDRAVKELVSREAISARRLYGESFDFKPTHHVWIRANHKPAALDSGDGFWRRIVLIPFEVTFPPGGPEDLDRRILEAEGQGILAWAVRGCLEWQRAGLNVPKRLRVATETYRSETDVLGQWFAECVMKDPENVRGVAAADAFHSAEQFYRSAGLMPLSKPAFTRRVARLGMEARRSNSVARFPGFALVDSDDLADGVLTAV